MKKVIQLSIMLGLLLALAACAGPTEEEALQEQWSENMQLAMEAFDESLRAFEELDADSSQAEVDQAISEYEAARANLESAAAEEGVDISGLEQALDEMEEQMRSAMADGEPLEFQQEFLSAWSDAMSEFSNLR